MKPSFRTCICSRDSMLPIRINSSSTSVLMTAVQRTIEVSSHTACHLYLQASDACYHEWQIHPASPIPTGHTGHWLYFMRHFDQNPIVANTEFSSQLYRHGSCINHRKFQWNMSIFCPFVFSVTKLNINQIFKQNNLFLVQSSMAYFEGYQTAVKIVLIN